MDTSPGKPDSVRDIALPSNLIVGEVIDRFVKYSGVVRTNPHGQVSHVFKPKRNALIRVNCAPVAFASAGGLCEFLSVAHWLSHAPQATSAEALGAQIQYVGTDALRQFNIGPDLLPLASPFQSATASFPLPPVRLQLPTPSPAGSTEAARARQMVLEVTELALETLKSAVPEIRQDKALRTSIADAVFEGLLNAYEHAYPSEYPEECREAWLAASLRPIGSTPRGRAISAWHRNHVKRGAQALLEVVVVDAGQGVPATLGGQFNRLFGSTPIRRIRDAIALHDAILEFAFSPYGSRKQRDEHLNETVRGMWRGLFRVLKKTQVIGGLALLRSGAGLFGHAFSEDSDTRITASNNLAAVEFYSSPGTSLTLRAPLPIANAKKHYHQNRATRSRTIDDVVHVPVSFRSSLAQQADIEPNLRTYASLVGRCVREHIERERVGEQGGPRTVLVVHPAVHFRKTIGEIADAIESNRQWAELLEMMTESTMPGVIPIHAFIELPGGDIEFAREQFLASTRLKATEAGTDAKEDAAVFGIHEPESGRIHWFLHGLEIADDEANVLAKTSFIEIPAGQPIPQWWDDLSDLYGVTLKLERTSGGRALSLYLPRELPDELARQCLSDLVINLASATPVPQWYWQARTPGAEFIRTQSGRLVAQYANAYSLCVAEPCIESSFLALFRRNLQRIEHGARILIVPDSTAASYLLAKRFYFHLRNERDNVEVLHPEEVRTRIKPGDCLAIFTDAVHTGDRIKQRQSELADIAPILFTFSCLDLRPQSARLEVAEPIVRACVRWPFAPPIADAGPGSRIYHVDLLSNEVVSSDGGRESGHYTSLLWQNTVERTTRSITAERQSHEEALVEVLERIDAFPYGVQLVDGLIHVTRCQVSRLIEDPTFFEISMRWICSIVASLLKGQQDIVLFTRDESAIRGLQRQIALRLGASLRTGPHRWTGRTFTAAIPATRRGHRQMLVHHPSVILSEATLAGPGADAQPQTDLFASRRKRETPRDGFLALFLDNATISARALRDFALAMAELTQHPRANSILICPIVSRLSPSEEKFLLRTPQLLPDALDQTAITFQFDALLQLRVGAHENFEAMPLVAKIRELLGKVDALLQPSTVREWIAGVRRKLATAIQERRLLQFPLHSSLDLPEFQASQNSVLIRHLLAVHQQGVPVMEALISRVRDALSAQDTSIILILAIEPDLLNEDILSRSFAPDITKLALATLDESRVPNAGMRSNALWLLFQTGSFAEHQRTIAERCALDEELRPQWLAQVFACSGDRAVAVERAQEKIELMLTIAQRDRDAKREAILHSVQSALHLVKRIATETESPRTPAEARRQIYRFLRETNVRHGTTGFPGWWSLDTKIRNAPSETGLFKDLANNDLWDQAEAFLHDTIAPTMDSLRIVAGGALKGGQEQFDAARYNADLCFKKARAAAVRRDRRGLTAAWNDVRRHTLTISVPELYGFAQENVLGVTEGGASLGYLDTMLPEIVQEPVGLLLHALDRDLVPRFRLRIISSDLAIKIDLPQGSARRIVVEDTIATMWRRSKRLPVIWTRIPNLRDATRLVSGNVATHGDAGGTCTVFAAVTDADNPLLNIEVANTIKLPIRPGNGNGLRQIEELFAKLGGAVSNRSTGDHFSIQLSLPIKWLNLS